MNSSSRNTHNLEDIAIVMSSNCIKENMDVIMVGSTGVSATVRLTKRYENELRKNFAASFVNDCLLLEEYVDVAKYVELAKSKNAPCIYEVGETGIFGALWELAAAAGTGITVNIKDIPIWQEVVEIGNHFDVNPYQADGRGAILIVCNDGDDMVKCFLDEGFLAQTIGKITDSNDRIAINGEDVRYLTPPKSDELENLL